MAPFLSVVIPAYNEASRLPATLARVEEYLAGAFPEHEIILVDDGSTDATTAVAKERADANPRIRVIENDVNRGKGWSVKTGILAARGEFVLFSDADLSTPIEEVEKLLPAMKTASVVIGTRTAPDLVRPQPFTRRWMGKTFNLIMRAMIRLPFHDTQCGFKLFTREAAQAVFSRLATEGFAFDVEAILRARATGFVVAAVPVRWINSPDSRVHVVWSSLQMLRDLRRVRRMFHSKALTPPSGQAEWP